MLFHKVVSRNALNRSQDHGTMKMTLISGCFARKSRMPEPFAQINAMDAEHSLQNAHHNRLREKTLPSITIPILYHIVRRLCVDFLQIRRENFSKNSRSVQAEIGVNFRWQNYRNLLQSSGNCDTIMRYMRLVFSRTLSGAKTNRVLPACRLGKRTGRAKK